VANYYTRRNANLLQRLKTRVLASFASLLPSNKSPQRRRQYPQLWYCMPSNKLSRKVLQFLCGLLGGHELSETEWGYGGGRAADRWCRWCDKLVKVPRESILFEWKEAKEMMRMVGEEVIEGGTDES